MDRQKGRPSGGDLPATVTANGLRTARRTRLTQVADTVTGPFTRVDYRLRALVLAGLLVLAIARLNTLWMLVVLSLAVPAVLGARLSIINVGALAAVFATLPYLTDEFVIFTFFTIGLYVLLGLGLNVVVGFAGLLDLGYVAFFAVGAYLAGFLASPIYDLHQSYFLILPLALLIAALVGVLLGIPVLRLRGDYLAIVTLGFGEIIRLLLNNLDDFTNGPQGIFPIDKPEFFGREFSTTTHLYFLVLGGCLLSGFVTNRLRDSRIGRAWEAIREDEEVAAAMGINLVRYKLLAFAIGAAFGGLGGALFGASQGAIFPPDFTLFVSINVVALVIIGGMGSIPGVIVGSLILIGAPEALRDLPSAFEGLKDYRLVIYGALLVLVMIFRPGGMVPSRRRRLEFQYAQVEAATETRHETIPPA